MTGMSTVRIPDKVGDRAIYFLYLKGEAVILSGNTTVCMKFAIFA